MKRFDSQKAVFKLGAVSQAKIAVLAADLAVAYASVAVLEGVVAEEAGGLTREQGAIHRACLRVIERTAAEIVGAVADNDSNFHSKVPAVPRGLGRVCHYCGCSKFDPCATEVAGDGRLVPCGWSTKSIMGVWDVCTACEAEGLADGTEDRERARRDEATSQFQASPDAGPNAPGKAH